MILLLIGIAIVLLAIIEVIEVYKQTKKIIWNHI
jgi:hypothetical protein